MRVLVALVIAGMAAAQEPQATVRVEVIAKSARVADATVSIDGKASQTDANGVAVGPSAMGAVEVNVVKEGFLPATVSLQVTEAREWGITVELIPLETVKEEITV